MAHRLMIAMVLLAACGKGTGDASLDELSALRDKMCACTDKACAEAVNKEVDAFFKRDRDRFDHMSVDKRKQSTQLEDQQYACWAKLK